MAEVSHNWGRLVRASLRREQLRVAGQSHKRSAVPYSLQRTTNIDAILQASDEIQPEDAHVARIMCEIAYFMAQNLDPNSDGTGVLRFKVALSSVIKQKLAKKDGGQIVRNRDAQHLWDFYQRYKRIHRIDEIEREEQKMLESGSFSADMGGLGLRSHETEKVYATLRALVEVLEVLSKEAAPDGVGRYITEELKRLKRTHPGLLGDLTPYNIVPLDAPSLTNAIGFYPEVRAAISALKYHGEYPRLPSNFEVSAQRNLDVFDLLEFVFGFQEDNIRNQRENVVLSLANAQSRLGIPTESDPKLDEKAITEVFQKVLDNYIKWCKYLRKRVVWNRLQAINKDRKLFLVSLYYLIWGEAANVRFLPECICYIFHNMARELDAILDYRQADYAKSCICEENNSVSFLDQVIQPIYNALSMEVERNSNGKAGHSAWRNYDDFNEYFWSPTCFELGWPMKENSPFLKSTKKKGTGKSIFVEHRTFLYLYRSFHRMWIFLVVMFQGLTIVAFNHGNLNLNTFKTLLSIGPTYSIMEFVECSLDVLLMYGAYSTARGMAISRLVIRFFWGALSSVFITYVYVKLLQERNDNNSNSLYFRIYLLVVGVYAGVRVVFAMLLKIPACHSLYQMSDHPFFQLIKWIYEIRSIHKRFGSFPQAFVNQLVSSQAKRVPINGLDPEEENDKRYAAQFSPFWNEIIKSLREEDYISNRERDLLSMPSNTGSLGLVQWPLFLLSSKIYLAVDLARDCKDNQSDLWGRITRDEYMAYAVQECYYSIEKILLALVDGEGKLWVERIFYEINNSMSNGCLLFTLDFKKLPLVLSRFNALTGLLIMDEKPELAKGAAKAVFELYDVVTHGLLSSDLSEQIDTWLIIARARSEGRLFANIRWPRDPDIKEQVKRLHLLLKMKDSAANVPKNLEARRRLEFFTNSLFMHMPKAKPVSEMMPFCVFTPYYSETVLYSSHDLWAENEDGISTIFYLQKIFPDEWENFLERIGRVNTDDVELQDSSTDELELRFWVSYRGQTLARTVRGMMYYRRALMLQSYLENRSLGGEYPEAALSPQGFELSHEARAQADLKFTYVVSCQIYGQQKQRKEKEAADIALLLQRNEALRVAFIHVEESPGPDGKITKAFYSKLVKADINGKEQEIYSIKLPGDPKLEEGKPENLNHAIVFTRGEAIQTIDLNQDNYLEEAMKMRNLLEEFRADHGLRPPTILGVRERVFTESVSSLAWFMSNQETSFVTLGQRVLAYPFEVRVHYGHPDVFDRIFHISRGGISKPSRVVNTSEDIYAGFSSTLRQGNITHHEYIQVGKRRDVGLNQIALYEGKAAGGNREQVLSRDVYRVGQLFDFFRMLSFYFTTVRFYNVQEYHEGIKDPFLSKSTTEVSRIRTDRHRTGFSNIGYAPDQLLQHQICNDHFDRIMPHLQHRICMSWIHNFSLSTLPIKGIRGQYSI